MAFRSSRYVVSRIIGHAYAYFCAEWNKDPNKELKKKLKDSKLKGGSAPDIQAAAVGDGQSSNRPKVPPVRARLPA